MAVLFLKYAALFTQLFAEIRWSHDCVEMYAHQLSVFSAPGSGAYQPPYYSKDFRMYERPTLSF